MRPTDTRGAPPEGLRDAWLAGDLEFARTKARRTTFGFQTIFFKTLFFDKDHVLFCIANTYFWQTFKH